MPSFFMGHAMRLTIVLALLMGVSSVRAGNTDQDVERARAAAGLEPDWRFVSAQYELGVASFTFQRTDKRLTLYYTPARFRF
jgi:hypothetical protein